MCGLLKHALPSYNSDDWVGLKRCQADSGDCTDEGHTVWWNWPILLGDFGKRHSGF